MSLRWASSSPHSCVSVIFCLSRLYLDQWEIGGREALKHGHGLRVRIREQVTENLAGRPFARRVRFVQMRLHALELLREVRGGRLALPLQLAHHRTRHGRLPSWRAPGSRLAGCVCTTFRE